MEILNSLCPKITRISPLPQTDSLTLWLYNLPALGIPGADNAGCLKAEHLEGIHTIYAVDEKDKGGKTFIRGITNHLQAIGWNGNLSSIIMPDGCKDPSDLHLELDSYDMFLNQIERIRKEAKPIEAVQPKKDVVELVKELSTQAVEAGKVRMEAQAAKQEIAVANNVVQFPLEQNKDWWEENPNGTKSLRHDVLGEYLIEKHIILRYPDAHGDLYY
jgi:hypothetical protein